MGRYREEVVITGDAKDLEAAYAKAQRSSKETQASIARIEKAGASFVKFGKSATKWVTLPLIGAGAAAVKFASDAEEVSNKVGEVFGDMADDIRAWSEDAVEKMGLADFTAQDMAATFGLLLKAGGLAGDAVVELSKDFTQLAADMSSFFNVPIDEALMALRSGLVGETEPLRRFGVLLSEARVQAKALELGLAATTSEVSEQAKVQARAAIIMESLTTASGDFERTSEGLANQSRMLREQLKQVAAEAGRALIPAFLTMVRLLSGLFSSFSNLGPVGQKAVVMFLALAAAVGPVALVVGKLMENIRKLQPLLLRVNAATGGWALRLTKIGAAATAAWIAVDMLFTSTGKLAEQFEVSEDRVGDVARQLDNTASIFRRFLDLGGDVEKALEILNEEMQRATERGASIEDVQKRVNAIWDEAVEKLGGFSGGFDEFRQALQEGLGTTRALTAATDRYMGMAEAARVETEDAARSMEDLAEEAREARQAMLELAGGLLAIEAASIRAEEAQEELRRAQRRVNRLQRRGKTDTKAYRDALDELRQAELDSIGAQISLEGAITSFADELVEAKVPLSEVIDKTIAFGRQAGVGRRRVLELIAEVVELAKSEEELPDEVRTHFEAPGLAQVLGGVGTLAAALRNLPAEHRINIIRAEQTIAAQAGGIARGRPAVVFGEGRMPTSFGTGAEAFIPLNARGVRILGEATAAGLRQVLGSIPQAGGGPVTVVLQLEGRELGRTVFDLYETEITRRANL